MYGERELIEFLTYFRYFLLFQSFPLYWCFQKQTDFLQTWQEDLNFTSFISLLNKKHLYLYFNSFWHLHDVPSSVYFIIVVGMLNSFILFWWFLLFLFREVFMNNTNTMLNIHIQHVDPLYTLYKIDKTRLGLNG